MTVEEMLRSMVDTGKVHHAIMLHEDDGGGAVSIALEFLHHLYNDDNKVLKLIHPDVHFIFPVTTGSLSESYSAEWRELVLSNPYFTEHDLTQALGIEGKAATIAVAEAKALLGAMSLSALEGGYRTALIYLPERMNTESANRLLKLIEEPPAQTQFVMVTHAPEKVLKTISSRCQQIRIVPGERRSSSVAFGEFSALMNALASRDFPAALEAGEAIAALPSRENLKAFCKFAGERIREIFLLQQGLDSLSSADGEISAWASSFSRKFPQAALSDFGRAMSLIERNVNQKILFTDLVDRLYLHL